MESHDRSDGLGDDPHRIEIQSHRSAPFCSSLRRLLTAFDVTSISCYTCQVEPARHANDHDHRRAGRRDRHHDPAHPLAADTRPAPPPGLHGRTGLYDATHRDRLAAILHLQEQGFSLESLGLLFAALRCGALARVGARGPGARRRRPTTIDADTDSAELYGFAELQPARPATPRGRPLLSVVPTTVWDESEAS